MTDVLLEGKLLDSTYKSKIQNTKILCCNLYSVSNFKALFSILSVNLSELKFYIGTESYKLFLLC